MTEPEHVQCWRRFLELVEIRGPIPMRFAIVQDVAGTWILESEMRVPDRDVAISCTACGRVERDTWITFHNRLPNADDPTPAETRLRMRLGLPSIAEARSCPHHLYDRRPVLGGGE